MDNLKFEYDRSEAFKCDNTLQNYSCKQCNFKTDLKTILTTHVHYNCQETEFNVTNYVCSNCNFMSYSILVRFIHQGSCNNRLEQHKLEVEDTSGENKLLSCTFCEYKFSAHKSLKDHYLNKHLHEMYKCNQCPFITTRKCYVRKHYRKLHSDREIVHFECQHCPYKTLNRGYLKIHIISHHTPLEEIKWLECTQCNYKSKTKKGLRVHTKQVHTKETYECNQCLFKTVITSSFYKHMRKHLEPNRFQCPYCSYKTTEKSTFKSHIKSRHTKPEEIEWFHCNHCTYKAKQKSALKVHITAKHSEEEFQCTECPFKTKYRISLKNHIKKQKHITQGHNTKTKKKVYPYKCYQCCYKTDCKTEFRNHCIVRHTEWSQKLISATIR